MGIKISAVKTTFADIANVLKKKAFEADVEALGLKGKEINAETVEKAFMESAKSTGQTSEQVLTQIRTEAREMIKAMNLPADATLEEVALKNLAAKQAYKIEHPIEFNLPSPKHLDITSEG